MQKSALKLLKSRIRKPVRDFNQNQENDHLIIQLLDSLEAIGKVNIDAQTIIRIAKRAVTDQRESSLLGMTIFLWIFEGLYVARLNEICLLLIGSGHDLFDPIKRSFASSMKKIEEVDISSKFKFLEEHGFRMILREKDRNLRNRIAHIDYNIDESGVLSIRGQNVDVLSRILELQLLLRDLTNVLVDCFGAEVKRMK